MIQHIHFTNFSLRSIKSAICTTLALVLLCASPLTASAVEAQDSQLFIAGFNAYQRGDYTTTITKMNQVLTAHGETPLRDMALFWLARAHFKSGNQRDAARYLSQFNKEYPDSPLRGTVEEELAALVPRYERGEPLAANPGQQPTSMPTVTAAERQAAEQLAAAKAAAEKAAQEKAEAERIAAEQLAAAKAAEERARAEKAEATRQAEARAAEQIAAAKATAEKAAREKAEAEQLAAEQLAAAKAAEERTKAEKSEAARQAEARAAEQIAVVKAAAEKAAKERQLAEAAAAERMAALKAEVEKKAAELAATEKRAAERITAASAAEKALRDQLTAEQAARQKAEADKAAAEKSAAQQVAAARTEAERQARTLIAQEQASRNQAEVAERTAREKLLASSLQSEKAERERAEAERAAAEKAAKDHQSAAQDALAKLETERQAAKKATQASVEAAVAAERQARQQAEAEKKAAAEQLAAATAATARAEAALAQERAARQQAEAQRLALEKKAVAVAPAAEVPVRPGGVAIHPATPEVSSELAAERAARERIEAQLAKERQAREQAETERAEAEKRAAALLAQAESAAAATESAPAASRPAKPAKRAKGGNKGANQLRDKAVAEYKRIIDRFPGSRAAASAATKLQELGIVYGGARATETAGNATMTSTARVLAFEVGQYASLELTGQPAPVTAQAGSRVLLPFELVNTGNGPDSFLLTTPAAPEFQPVFAAATTTNAPLTTTPPLAPGERFKGVVALTVPSRAIDGERLAFPIRATSQFTTEVSQSREMRVVSSAPLLRAVFKADKQHILPGETVNYKISLLNVGSAPGRDLTFRLVHPAQLLPTGELVGVQRESATSAILEGLTLQSGESRELNISFRLAADALAQQELFVQGELSNPALNRRDSFLAQAVTVETVRGVTATATTRSLVAIPGQRVVIPLVVTNTGNVREDYSLAAAIPAALSYALYHDLNRDGLKQAGEPVINHVGPLAPREVAHVLLELNTPASATDGTSVPLAMSFISDADRTKSARVELSLTHSRPVLDLTVNGKVGRIRPGDASTFELDCVNRGSSLAKIVELESILPDQLELVAADPAFTSNKSGRYLWTFEELGSGEKRNIKITYRIKSGTAQGTSIQLQNLIRYQDLQGNKY